MLVLSRMRDEIIMIGDDVEVTIVEIRGDKVRLGITAPLTVPVHRKEVYLAIRQANLEAAEAADVSAVDALVSAGRLLPDASKRTSAKPGTGLDARRVKEQEGSS